MTLFVGVWVFRSGVALNLGYRILAVSCEPHLVIIPKGFIKRFYYTTLDGTEPCENLVRLAAPQPQEETVGNYSLPQWCPQISSQPDGCMCTRTGTVLSVSTGMEKDECSSVMRVLFSSRR